MGWLTRSCELFAGNIEADEEGVAIINITDKLIALIGPMSVIGRSVVVAGKEDDLGKVSHQYHTCRASHRVPSQLAVVLRPLRVAKSCH